MGVVDSDFVFVMLYVYCLIFGYLVVGLVVCGDGTVRVEVFFLFVCLFV